MKSDRNLGIYNYNKYDSVDKVRMISKHIPQSCPLHLLHPTSFSTEVAKYSGSEGQVGPGGVVLPKDKL